MPELPEVENVKNNLQEIMALPNKISRWTFYRKDLRFPLPQKKMNQLVDHVVFKIERRAKYILLFLERDQVLIFHLGMTGHWRARRVDEERRKHDHVVLQFSSGLELIYEDPRRFGFIEVCQQSKIVDRFKGLGIEPLDSSVDWGTLTSQFRKLSAPIKSAIMNQKKIVGVGNIYASEALFRAGISPLKKCSKISLAEYAKLWKQVQKVLRQAIKQGGSTIDTFQNSYGEKGAFQNNFFVYGRDGLRCRKCLTGVIQQKKIAGRSTFWCDTCQRS